jgi:hypothetical protein
MFSTAQEQGRLVSSMGATPRGGVAREAPAGPAGGASPAPADARGKLSARLVLRSPEAMVYYLGEVVRWQNLNRRPLLFPDGPTRERDFMLFDMPTSEPDRTVLKFDYQGETYHVPPYAAGNRTVHVLSLMTQIIGLQNRGTTSPATANVRIVQ